ncbi:MAG: PAS domain-containing protein [Aphanocapsa sp. GSE-SYN-MK-11-07L]|nr:PAS domain-containing protein [Aphanocapsa sp. GSE-SYN-MK-11-07L]
MTAVKLPLRWVLVVPFLLQIFAVVGLTGFLAYKNGQRTVGELVQKLGNEAGEHTQQKLINYLNTAQLVNRINADVISLDSLKLTNRPRLERYLWQQMRQFKQVSEINLGTTEGDFLGAESLSNGSIALNIANQNTNGSIRTYATNVKGERTKLLRSLPNFDPRNRPWYQQAVQARRPVWSQIYPSFLNHRLEIAASRPLYDAEGTLRGVASATLSLERMSQFLQELNISPNGQTWVISPTGLLVATSTPKATADATQTPSLLQAAASPNPLTRASAEALTEQVPDLKAVTAPRYLEFDFQGQRQFLIVLPFETDPDLDWLIAVVVPERDFMAQVQDNTRNTLLLCLGALALATALGVYTSRWISRPILKLSEASSAIAQGANSAHDRAILQHSIDRQNIFEIDVLAQSFNQMAKQLGAAFLGLEQANSQLEQRVARRTNALRQAEAELRGLLCAMNELILVFDANGTLVKIAQTSTDLPDKPTEAAIGKSLAEVFPTAQVDELAIAIQQALGIQQTHIVEYCHRIGEKEIWCSASISPINEQNVILVARDITEEHEAAIELQEDLDREKQLNELKSRFVSMTSHEFRTPLTTILSSVDLLESRSHNWAEARDLKHLERIQTAVKRMTALLNDVLVISKADADRLEFDPTELDIEDYCRNLVEEMQPSATAKHQLVFEVKGQCGLVWMDEKLLQHILPNLLSNALKYSPDGGQVFFRLHCQAQAVRFEVQDQGIGIPPSDRDQIFDSFHRARNVGNISGTGLGLAIVKKSVDLHGGTVHIDSQVGEGTTFTVVLPTHRGANHTQGKTA